jgi:ADP-heptose:LPS heptosyltransferase
MNISLLLKASLLKLISRHKLRPIKINRSPKFLILMHQNIGDMIVCSPILREIKNKYPECILEVVASQVNKEIAFTNPYIDKVYLYQNRWHRLLPLLMQLRSCNFDFAIELEAKIITRVILMLKIINPRCILSVSKREGRYGIDPDGVMPYDYYTNSNLNHQRDTCLDILRLLGINFKDKKYDIFYLPKHKKKASEFVETINSKKIIIALNITGSSNEKRISNKNISKLTQNLYSKSKNIVIILLHKPEHRKWLRSLISHEQSSYVLPSYPTESILDVGALVDAVDLVITPDTSLVHIACAFDKPLLAIYRNDVNAFKAWHPKSSRNRVVFSKEFNSLETLNIDEISSKAFELISLNIKKEL